MGMPNDERINDKNSHGASNSKNPFADSNWAFQGDKRGRSDGVIDFGVNSAKRMEDPLSKARNMPSQMPENSFRDAWDMDARRREQAAPIVSKNPPQQAGVSVPPSIPDKTSRMRMPDGITPSAPLAGGAVSAWSAMVQNMKMATDSSNRTIRISAQESAGSTQPPASVMSPTNTQFPSTQISIPAQPVLPVEHVPQAIEPIPEMSVTHIPERRIVAYAGLFAKNEGAYSEIILDGGDKLVKLPGFDRAAGADISFPNAIIIRNTGVYLVNYEMNIKYAEDAGTIALSLLINGKPEIGHVHEANLCDMLEDGAIPQAEEIKVDRYHDVQEENAAPKSSSDESNDLLIEPGDPFISDPVRMSWHGFMELQSGDHISLRVSSSHAGRLHMDNGRHTFVNIILLEPLSVVDARTNMHSESIPLNGEVFVPPPPLG